MTQDEKPERVGGSYREFGGELVSESEYRRRRSAAAARPPDPAPITEPEAPPSAGLSVSGRRKRRQATDIAGDAGTETSPE